MSDPRCGDSILPMRGPKTRYRAALRTTLRKTAAAYGYALTVGMSAAALSSKLGPPSTGDLFLFAGGGLSAFAALEACLLLSRDSSEAPDDAFPFAGALNVVSVAAGLGAAVGLVEVLHSGLAWFLAPLVATIAFMLGVAVQITAVSLLRRRSR